MDVARLVGGDWLFQAMAILLVLANVGAASRRKWERLACSTA
jgi:hypothetical protein